MAILYILYKLYHIYMLFLHSGLLVWYISFKWWIALFIRLIILVYLTKNKCLHELWWPNFFIKRSDFSEDSDCSGDMQAGSKVCYFFLIQNEVVSFNDNFLQTCTQSCGTKYIGFLNNKLIAQKKSLLQGTSLG